MAASGRKQQLTVVTLTWPVVLMVLPAVVTDHEIRALIEATESVYARGERFAMIVDTRATRSVPGALERKLLIDWLGRPEHAETLKRLSVASVTVVESALVRGSLQAILWLWSPPNPHSVAHDLDEATRYVSERLGREGLSTLGMDDLRRTLDREVAQQRARLR
ncbi:MAG: hypothetical protein K1X94_29095 [Sandaracinaceae bacterium]|nr:hypothetical protein [Sandaracinaceae bacterium]